MIEPNFKPGDWVLYDGGNWSEFFGTFQIEGIEWDGAMEWKYRLTGVPYSVRQNWLRPANEAAAVTEADEKANSARKSAEQLLTWEYWGKRAHGLRREIERLKPVEILPEIEQFARDWHEDHKHGGLYRDCPFELCKRNNRTAKMDTHPGSALLSELQALRDLEQSAEAVIANYASKCFVQGSLWEDLQKKLLAVAKARKES
jgi:hypothetical protein